MKSLTGKNQSNQFLPIEPIKFWFNLFLTYSIDFSIFLG